MENRIFRFFCGGASASNFLLSLFPFARSGAWRGAGGFFRQDLRGVGLPPSRGDELLLSRGKRGETSFRRKDSAGGCGFPASAVLVSSASGRDDFPQYAFFSGELVFRPIRSVFMEQNVPLLSLSVMKIPFRRMERRILLPPFGALQ